MHSTLIRDPYIHSNQEALKFQKVSSLMTPGDNSWDLDLIADIFDDRDANLIVSIPLNINEKDSWYWHREKLGQYSVKSAYALIQEGRTSSHAADNSGFWRRLWNLKIPPKVKNFLWRATKECLPTKDLLCRRRVPVNVICPTCNNAPESILHSLVTCSYAEASWSKLAIPALSGEFSSFTEWLQLVFQQRSSNDVHITVMICWMLWKARNDLVW